MSCFEKIQNFFWEMRNLFSSWKFEMDCASNHAIVRTCLWMIKKIYRFKDENLAEKLYQISLLYRRKGEGWEND